MGNVGGTDVSDFTVLSDTVNVAARLQSAAQAVAIAVTEPSDLAIANLFPDAPVQQDTPKGQASPVPTGGLTVEVMGTRYADLPPPVASSRSTRNGPTGWLDRQAEQ